VRLTVWSLVERRPIYLPGPKFADRGIAFSPRGDQLAVLEVGVVVLCLVTYSCARLGLASHVSQTCATVDANRGAAFSPRRGEDQLAVQKGECELALPCTSKLGEVRAGITTCPGLRDSQRKLRRIAVSSRVDQLAALEVVGYHAVSCRHVVAAWGPAGTASPEWNLRI
jgi:hypothetical protein